jgi:transcription initiation factor TFIIIB Brf1 subunit/transcription initiation factor TFIIB
MAVCIYCGSSEIVYDTASGYIVCSSCGTINDVIYDSSSEIYRRAHGYQRDPGLTGSRDPGKRWGSSANKGSLYRIYRDLVSSRRLRRGVVVKERTIQDLASGGRKLLVFGHVRDTILSELLERSPVLKKIIDIMREYPSLYSRTNRGRVAAAYLAAKLAIKDPIVFEPLARFFGLSRVHLKRIKISIETTEDLIVKVAGIGDLSREVANIDHMIKSYLDREGL